MKKIPLIILLLLLMAGQVWGATYYVSTGGTAKGATACATFLTMAANQTTPAKTVADMTSCQASLSDGDIIAFKRGDTWAEQLINAHANITFTAYGTGWPPKFTGASGFSARSNVAGQTYYGLWFDELPVYFSSTASGTQVSYCLITTIITNHSGAIQAMGTTANIYNNIIKSRSLGIYINKSDADVSIINNLMVGGGYIAPRISKVAGSCTAQNNLFFGAHSYPSQYGVNTGCTDSGGNIGMAWTDDIGITDVPQPPAISSSYSNPKVVIVRDDRQNALVFLADIAAVEARGVTGYRETLADFAYNLSAHTAGTVTSLQAAIDAGHEVVLHSSTGSAIGQAAPYTAFTISTTNGGTNTITIDAGSAKTLTLTSSGNPENNVSIDWSVTRKEVCDLKAALGQSTCTSLTYAGKGWTITPDSNISASLSLSSLADATCSSFPCVVALDKGTATNRFFYDEIIAGKAVLEATLNRPVYSFMAHQLNDSASRAYIKDSELYKGHRAGNVAGTSAYLDGIDIWNVYGIPSIAFANSVDTNEATVRANTRTIYGWAKYSRAVITTYFHTTAYITSEQVGWIADEFKRLGAEFMTFSELMDWIKADHTSADGITYTKTYIDIPDFYLRSGPAINAGVDVGLTTDADGKRICGKPDIGAYERCSKPFF